MKINFVCPVCSCSLLQEVIITGSQLTVTEIDITTRSLNYEKLLHKTLNDIVIHGYRCANCSYTIPKTDTQVCQDNIIKALHKWLEDNGMLLEEE